MMCCTVSSYPDSHICKRERYCSQTELLFLWPQTRYRVSSAGTLEWFPTLPSQFDTVRYLKFKQRKKLLTFNFLANNNSTVVQRPVKTMDISAILNLLHTILLYVHDKKCACLCISSRGILKRSSLQELCRYRVPLLYVNL